MVRYLVLFAYNGTRYSGVQNQIKTPVKTVLSTLRDALMTTKAIIDPALSIDKVQVTVASRTDRGVHALCNAMHIDFDSQVFENLNPNEFAYHMNIALSRLGEDITLLKGIKVPRNFNSRFHALSRTYLYKMCLLDMKDIYQSSYIPIDDYFKMLPTTPLFDEDRCMFIRRDLDMDLVREAAKLMSGKKDFRAFTTSDMRREIEMEGETEWREIRSLKDMEIQIYPSNQLADPYISKYYRSSYQMWNFSFKARSFLYRQIRKMMAAMVSVGFGKTSLSDLEKLFDEKTNFSLPSSSSPPSPMQQLLMQNLSSVSSSAHYSNLSSAPLIAKQDTKSWPLISPPNCIYRVPPCGLYLSNIEYPKEILDGTAMESGNWRKYEDIDD